ncbi:uncharacterized protein N0V89_010904 [Didymosphaeria variabile]|uniref:Uncharacterized protein n=1 Tax=Didymosphaeria variabile TaxID=1932322 RepID=A0A9W9C6L2_9PLEO|nr:uncharacterized protein N0V89_010904 [Didymosphaeria variabile]KAJ4346971.1 hypothetical protein N0V89_010904 [Didymosphaeria variabile]
MALNPIACEHCRAKKCKSHIALNVKLYLWLAATPKDRLAETEAALFSALTTIGLIDNNGAGLAQLLVNVSAPSLRGRSKVEKQDEWKRLPLRSGQQLLIWLEEKSQTDYHAQHPVPSPPNEHPQSTQSDEFASNEPTEAVETSAEPSSIDNAATARTPTNIHLTTQFQDSAQWRNYF